MTPSNDSARAFFAGTPWALPIYDTIEDAVLTEAPEAEIRVHKTQITYWDVHAFAFASLPFRRMKGWPERCLVFSLGLARSAEHPRVLARANPYPNRWTLHAVLAAPDDLDDDLRALLHEAHDFALVK
ncbi:MAG: DUF5655 domain-containing protein [Propionibacteriaceae bacterium]|jgi:hypothetical protein|nr:DUF5655 domain-containing protein [Propionibacteriaceae bacterium]